MKNIIFRIIAVLAVVTIPAGCTTSEPRDSELATIDDSHLPVPDISLKIAGLSSCTTNPDTTIHLNSREPVTVIIHGCYGSAGRYRALAQVFAFHGQQTVCFNYNDRDSMMRSSAQLIDALESLSLRMHNSQITVIGHSQGGLIARKALVQEREVRWEAEDAALRLVTISSPFAGIAVADHCASPTVRVLSLGLVVLVCKLISGDKWYEITQPSPFIQKPGELLGQVQEHVKIVTDETGTCRYYDSRGVCVEDDYVFSVAEQYFEPVDASLRVDNIEVEAGHVEIVGDYRVSPRKLIDLLQRKGIMNNTTATRRQRLEELLSRLYLR